MENQNFNDYEIIFKRGDKEISNNTNKQLTLSYHDVNDNLKPDCFKLYVRSALAEELRNNITVNNMKINPYKLAFDIVSNINLELYRPYIMDQNIKDPYDNQSVILLSNIIIEYLNYYGIYDVSIFNIISFF